MPGTEPLSDPLPARNEPADFQRRLEVLDTSLFAPIVSQTTEADRTSLLSVQAAVRRRRPGYVYLEIGSYLGGTLQPHVRDPACRKIYSIDKRPAAPPDERDGVCVYEDNSTAHMLHLLRQQDRRGTDKIECFDQDASEIDRARITEPPDLCFIDGEHTDRAVLSDFAFCLKVCRPDAVIVFHDAARVHRGLRTIQRTHDTHLRGLRLRGSVYAILLGDNPAADEPEIRRLAGSGPLFLTLLQLRAFYQAQVPSALRQRLKPLLRPLASQLPR